MRPNECLRWVTSLEMAVATKESLDQLLARCIDDCLNCGNSCEKSGAAVVKMGMKEMERCIELCRDCADICVIDARFLSRRSEFDGEICRICIDCCDQCGAECDRMAGITSGDTAETLKNCAEACRACSISCQEVVQKAA